MGLVNENVNDVVAEFHVEQCGGLGLPSAKETGAEAHGHVRHRHEVRRRVPAHSGRIWDEEKA